MLSKNKKGRSVHYLAMWDMNGLECVIDVTKHLKEVKNHEKKVIWEVLKDENFKDIGPPKIPLNMMILRARYNSQRQYEIYEFMSAMDIDEIKKVFQVSPQSIVDWIRKNGHKVYSDYTPRTRKHIS